MGLPLLISIIVHLVLFTIIGGVILYPGYVTQNQFLGQMIHSHENLEVPPEDLAMLDPIMEESGGGGEIGDDSEMTTTTTDTFEIQDLGLDAITSTFVNPAYSIPPAAGVSGAIDMIGGGGLGGPGSGGGKGSGIGKGIGNGVFSGMIGGMKVEAQNLGVVLDTSLSAMKNYRPLVEGMIVKNFPEAIVETCGKGYWADVPKPNSGHPWGHQSSALERLLIRGEQRGAPLDVIYMLFDGGEQNDIAHEDDTHQKIRKLLERNKTKIMIQLTDDKTEKDLHKELVKTVKLSGGSIITMKLKPDERKMIQANANNENFKHTPTPEFQKMLSAAKEEHSKFGLKGKK